MRKYGIFREVIALQHCEKKVTFLARLKSGLIFICTPIDISCQVTKIRALKINNLYINTYFSKNEHDTLFIAQSDIKH